MSTAWQATEIPDVWRTGRLPIGDDRGSFTKIIGAGDEGTASPFRTQEIFWSRSARGVFRGLHFQLPPHATRKVVFVVSGSVRDFVLDLRVGSPTYGVVAEFDLGPTTGGLVIPVGCAHGFEALVDDTAMVYAQEEWFSADHDAGVNVISSGIVLAAPDPIISARDRALPSVVDFESPFVYA